MLFTEHHNQLKEIKAAEHVPVPIAIISSINPCSFIPVGDIQEEKKMSEPWESCLAWQVLVLKGVHHKPPHYQPPIYC